MTSKRRSTRSLSSKATIPRCLASTRSCARSAATRDRRVDLVIAILLLLHAVFDSVRTGLLIFLSLPGALDRRRRRRAARRRRVVARLLDRFHHGARHIRAQRHHAREPLSASRTRRASASAGVGAARRRGAAGADTHDDPDDLARLCRWCWAASVRATKSSTRWRSSFLAGSLTSALLNLFVVPALYLRFAKRGRRGLPRSSPAIR